MLLFLQLRNPNLDQSLGASPAHVPVVSEHLLLFLLMCSGLRFGFRIISKPAEHFDLG